MSLPRSLIALVAITAAGCPRPHDVTVAYGAQRADTGALDVVLNSAGGALSVTINDALVVDRKFSRKAHIDGLPAGPARIQIATGGGCEQAATYDRDVEIIPGATVSLALPGPEPNTGCMIYAGLSYIGMNIALGVLAAMTIVLAGTAASDGK